MWERVDRIGIAAPVERVWAIVSDFEGHPRLAGSGEVLAIRLHGPVAEGTWFDGDTKTGEVGSFVSRNRIEVVDAPHELVWESLPPLDEGETDDHQIVVRWWFRLAATAAGTDAEHGFQVAPPRKGAEELGAFLERTGRLATVAAGMRQTLQNLKAIAEA